MNKYPREQLPEALTATSATARATTTSTTPRWAPRTPQFVTDEIVDRFCAPRRRRPSTSRKLRVLAEAGVDQFNLYLMNGDEEEQLEIYGARGHPGACATWRPPAA